MNLQENILIIDFGSQYTQLIARRIRENKVYSEIFAHTIDIDKIKSINPSGIILSGGPLSVYDEDSPQVNPDIFKLGIPILGICYGLQLTAKYLNGNVSQAQDREYGRAILQIEKESSLLKGIKNESYVWMSHGDFVNKAPEGFEITAVSDHSPICAISNEKDKIFGVQFHPEVNHTEQGNEIIKNFLFNICNCKGNWTPESFIITYIK